jgi:signal transduction histidine kinase
VADSKELMRSDEPPDQRRSFKRIFKQHPTRDKIAITVEDSGIGIKKKNRIKLFKLFGNVKSTQHSNT